MRAVNLLPRDEQRTRFDGARAPFLVAAGGIVLVTALAAVLSFSAAGTADDREARIAVVESALQELPKAPQSEVSQGTLIRERADRVNALAAALSTRVAFDRVLQEISYVFPENAWLTNFEAAVPAPELAQADGAPPPPPASGQPAEEAGVTIQGASFTHEGVATVLSRLALVPSLQNVQLSATSLVEPAPAAPDSGEAPQRVRPHVTFVVKASLRTGAEQ
jgi:Tfp pilus assembly protein PilN